MLKIATAALLVALLLLVSACKDVGTNPYTGTPPPPPPPGGGTLTFSATILPIFQAAGCPGCHGGTSGLTVTSVASLLAGGVHGPAIIPGNAAGSNLVKKISATPPFGERMPAGGPYLPDSTIQKIKDWINAGAPN